LRTLIALRARMTLRKSIPLLLAVLLIIAARPARADCTEDGSSCDGLAAAVYGAIAGLTIDAAVGVGGVITLVGGAVDVGTHRNSRGWRIANYVFGSLNLVHGLVWGGLAASRISPALTASVMAPHLALGAGDLTLAVVSSRSAGQMALALRPMAGRDSTGHSVAGISVQLIAF
jgi:hypothetical protein